jgi:hypothetical protein
MKASPDKGMFSALENHQFWRVLACLFQWQRQQYLRQLAFAKNDLCVCGFRQKPRHCLLFPCQDVRG